ncbi:MAG: LamB/YcsF family protein [Gemmatimonadaceae bacterium]|nr:LamB/YcsF family protein [Gemmatimonadaceae bacterium]
MTHVDLNCDMGESIGPWPMGNDAAVLPCVTSISVACGFHAGDPSVMRATVTAAAAHGVAIGAHPGLPDLAGFGRRDMAISLQEAYDHTAYQLGALQAICTTAGTQVRHVKPHGALYNMAAVREDLADAIARAVRDVDPSLALFGLSGSALIDAGTHCSLRVVSEVFADRHYQPDGTLVPRSHPQALVTDVDLATERALRMVQHRSIVAIDGSHVPVTPDTICIHGDGRSAQQFALRIRAALHAAGIDVRAPHAARHA